MGDVKEFASAPYTAGQLNAMVKKLKELAGEDGPEKLLRGDLVVKPVDLLTRTTTFSAFAVFRFAAADHFTVNTPKKAKVKLGWLGDSFRTNFLNKVEENIPATTLSTHTLTKDSPDAPILARLGDKAETSLAHLWQLLEAQGRGQSGPLLTNGYANIFYIRDTSGTLWAVFAGWGAGCGGWDVHVRAVDGPRRWHAGRRVVSR